ncbi:MAG TPA: glutaredoxin domain-containing protein [Burkholderiales bacterium]|nr:glutaredoxin domain-containing protein [Burkholderiales bacterium]
MTVKVIMMLGLLAPLLASAATLYKSVMPDGRVVYSDQPPATGKIEQTFNFSNLPSTPMPESVVRYRQELEKGMQKRLANSAAPSGSTPVLFSASWCKYCRQAEAYLAEKRIAYQRQDIDTPEGMKALVQSGSGRGVPVLLVSGQRVQGFSRPAYDALFAKK